MSVCETNDIELSVSEFKAKHIQVYYDEARV